MSSPETDILIGGSVVKVGSDAFQVFITLSLERETPEKLYSAISVVGPQEACAGQIFGTV